MPSSPPDKPQSGLGSSQFKRRAFRMVIVAFWLVVGTTSAELLLQFKDRHIRQADQIDPGFLRYDERIGWSLTPNWSGEHRGYDFTVRYQIDGSGFRHDATPPPASDESVVAVVGDSFTFGLGVNEDQTFVHLLDEWHPGGMRFRNLALPGTSTDQQALLIERQLKEQKPGRVLLVLYLGNDLIDNQLTTPIQLNLAKPKFAVQADGLALTNVPVPQGPSDRPASQGTFARAVYGDEYVRTNLRYRWEQRSALFRLFSEMLLAPPSVGPDFYERHEAGVQLGIRILERVAADCERSNVRFTLAILGGRSLVENPGSISSLYQEYCRKRLVASGRERRWNLIDLAQALRASYLAQPGQWYYPNDGHLNPSGHRLVAQLIAEALIAESERR